MLLGVEYYGLVERAFEVYIKIYRAFYLPYLYDFYRLNEFLCDILFTERRKYDRRTDTFIANPLHYILAVYNWRLHILFVSVELYFQAC